MARLLVSFFIFSIFCVLNISAADVNRPCGSKKISNLCLGTYFANHSTCKREFPQQSTLDPLALDHFFFATPYFNVTEDRYNITIKGASQAFVKDFFYNTTSGKAVLSIYFPTLSFEGDAHLHGFIPDSEGFEVVTHYKVNFTQLTMTTIFPNYKKLSLDNSISFPDIPVWPTYDNGDELTRAAAADARVARLLAAYEKDPMVATMEAFKYRGPALVKLYTYYKLCYGL